MDAVVRRKPPWLRFSIPGGPNFTRLKAIIADRSLHTVCAEARCPNIGECFSCGTATFLILGNLCTRNCRYCSIPKGAPAPPDESEPERVASAVASMGLRYAVVTSVTRDDLPDGGAGIFAETIRQIRNASPACAVEVLVPDFGPAMESSLSVIAEAAPEVLNHNIEVVQSLFGALRPLGDYALSLRLLERAAESGLTVKSGLMVGFGESMEEIRCCINDLADAGCSIVTVGQYLQSSRNGFVPVKFYHPDDFRKIDAYCRSRGIKRVMAGPLVRSSYHAADMAVDPR